MNQILKSVFGVFVFSLLTFQLSAQCTESTGDTDTVLSNPSLGQTITAACSGELTSITVDVGNHFPGTFATAEVKHGDCMGSALASQSFSTGAQGDVTITFDNPATVTQGETYYLVFTHPSFFGLRGTTTTNPYSGGGYFNPANSCGTFGTWDLEFSYSINESSGGGGASCDNSSTASSYFTSPAMGSAGGSTVIGQSITVDASCYNGNAFSSFTFHANGNQTTTWTVEIFSGQTDSGSPLYTESGISVAPTNQGGFLEIPLSGNGTGSLGFTDGQTYTFICTLTSGIVVAHGHDSDTYSGGQMYEQGSFDSGKDLRFQVDGDNTETAAVPTMGEWALIIFALIIMSMGVVTVMRFQKERNRQLAKA